MTENEQEYYISRHDRISGPFSLGDINRQLKRREISTLHKIQVNGEWELLRNFLASAKREKIRLDKEQTEQNRDKQYEPEAVPLREAVVREEDEGSEVEDAMADANHLQNQQSQTDEAIPGRGFGIAAFALSLFFFLPIINAVCFILALIFGHLSLSKTPESLRKDQNTMPWFGVSHTYIHALYLIGSLLMIANWTTAFEEIFLAIHLGMISNAIGACILAGLLMLAVRMIADYFPRYYVCYIVLLLSSSLWAITQTMVNLTYEGASKEKTIVLILAGFIVMCVNTIICAQVIRDEEGEQLGYGQALLASIFCLIIYAFGIFLIAAYFASLFNKHINF